jgi:uncharacterized protein
MPVELRPLGVTCNLRCEYCYQNPQRDAGNVSRAYDMRRMKAAIVEEGGPFTLFGGEPLLIPLQDLEELWSWGAQEFGVNYVQTNGTLITDAHLALFKKYNVRVGVSLDGPGELNDARWHGTLAATRRATQRAEAALARMCQAGVPPGLIITLHRLNADNGRLPILLEWIVSLDRLGIRSTRLHLLESESDWVRAKYGLTEQENVDALLALAELQTRMETLKFDVFADMYLMLTGRDHLTSCVWNACDPYTTRAVRGVEGDGRSSNCGRTNKEGVDFIKADTEGFERYIALYHTPQSAGGCQGCRYFLMCKGQCPGTAIGRDWRNRTEHCGIWKCLYERLEREMLAAGEQPLSLSPNREKLEQEFLAAWSTGVNTSMARLLPHLRDA